METYTKKTKIWLEQRFMKNNEDGSYFSHAPIYGYAEKKSSEKIITKRYSRIFKNLTLMNNLNFDSFLDVGGAEGFMAHLVKKLFNKSFIVTADLSIEANKRARELFDINSVALDIHQLPFKDNSFDLVLCSETIEHVTNAEMAIKELCRVAKKHVIISTPRAFNEKMKLKYFRNRDKNVEHDHINFFTKKDLEILLGKNTKFFGVRFLKIMEVIMAIFDNEELTEKRKKMYNKNLINIYNFLKKINKFNDIKSAERLIYLDYLITKMFPAFSDDIFAVKSFDEKDYQHALIKPKKILKFLLHKSKISKWQKYKKLFDLNPELLTKIRCVKCFSDLKLINNSIIECTGCKERYKIHDGVIDLIK